MKKKALRIPNEPRFVQALTLAVEPADALALLLEIGAISSHDLAPVRKVRESFNTAYDAASDAKDWPAVDVIGVLAHALTSPDNQAYLAYHQADRLTTLATIYGASCHRGRPWNSQPDQMALETLHRILMQGSSRLLPPGQPDSVQVRFDMIEGAARNTLLM